MYGKKNYSACNRVHYELPCKQGAVVIVQELELGAGDMLQIDGVNITGPTTVDLPQVFFLPPEDMNFTFTADCCDQRHGFRVLYICMSELCVALSNVFVLCTECVCVCVSPLRTDKEGRDFIESTGVANDCMIRDCLKVRMSLCCIHTHWHSLTAFIYLSSLPSCRTKHSLSTFFVLVMVNMASSMNPSLVQCLF